MIQNRTTRLSENVTNETAIRAPNFILYIYILKKLDTLLLRPSLHFTILHPSTTHSTSLHLLALHFFPFKLHPTPLHYPLIWLNPISISYRSISPTAPFHFWRLSVRLTRQHEEILSMDFPSILRALLF